MKLPTDEEIEIIKANMPKGSGWSTWDHGMRQLRDQVKPLFDLAEELREARKQWEAFEPCTYSKEQAANYLKQLRDKLELGE